ncbi:uncharacterized protein LOC122615659 [Drosophila teissieri]|uniref:uncharacterized protein LOC122615659 n=1 Tax=Drosophila teissieri TaxID=7243 RepID=UPI001CBA341B|nr:uncharacterized protein LOC122615659 [Drosophila teissieri]
MFCPYTSVVEKSQMDEELELISRNLSDVLAKLKNSKHNDLQDRKLKMARLIRLHLQHVQTTVVTLRRRTQQRTRRRFRMLRTLFMRQMMEMHSNYLHMYAMLRLKHSQVMESDSETSDVDGEPQVEMGMQGTFPCFDSHFFEHVIPDLSEEEFLNTLHVTRGTFETLCKQLSPTLRTSDELTQRAPAISTEKCVALALYFLASGERLSLIAERFSLPRPRTIKCLKVFCNAVMSTLGRALRQLPQHPVDCNSVAEGFQRESNMPAAIVGVLGVCSIPIRANGDAKNSILRMEYLLDDRMLFRELQLGCGLRATLGPMFSHAPNTLTAIPKFRINSRPVPAFVLAPVYQNYPLRPWLLQRYTDPLAPHEHDFNEVAEHLQELSDCALHRLMSRWSFLSQPLDISFHTASCIITAAAVLHNLLEELSEPHMLEWGNSVDVSKFRAEPLPDSVGEDAESHAALEVRDFLARTISSTEM